MIHHASLTVIQTLIAEDLIDFWWANGDLLHGNSTWIRSL